VYGTSRLSPRTREFLVQESMRIGVSVAARQVGASRRTVYRWRRRAGVYVDRSSRPHRSPQRTPDELEATVLALRLDQRWGPDRIAGTLGMHASTIHRILRRHHVERLSHVFPKPPRSIGRFDVREPGELIALDTKKLGRLDRGGGRRAEHRRSLAPVGWRHLHVAIDLASRLVYTELRPGEGNLDTTAFVDAACAFFDRQGIRVRRVLTDNGRGYRRTFREHCQRRDVRHTHTKPRHPWTNGRVERFIGTIQRECLYAGAYFTSEDERALAIWHWLAYYNWERPHIALGGLSPQTWLRQRRTENQVPGDLI